MIWITLIMLSVNIVTGKNILFVPIQHQKAYAASQEHIMNELLLRGHNVTMVLGSNFSESFKPSNPAINLVIFQQSPNRIQSIEVNSLLADVVNTGERLDGMTPHPAIKKLLTILHEDCKDMWKDHEFIQTLRSMHFDTAYVDLFLFEPCNLILPFNLSISMIGEMPLVIPWLYGIPALPSFVPFPVSSSTDKMNFIERLVHFVIYFVVPILPIQPSNMTLMDKYATGIKSWNDLAKQCSLYVIDRDHSIDWPQPMMPNTIFIPGKSFSEPKELPSNILSIMDKAEKGIILISFGSMFNSLSPDYINRFIKTFKLLTDYNVIYSYGGDSSKLESIPTNVFMSKWVPQNDILAHPKTQLFITHGGHRGLIEAIYHGVPVVPLGITKEQISNGIRAEQHGYGRRLDFYTFKPEELHQEILEVLNNPVYSNNVKHMSAILKDNPEHPTETVSYWIEHVAKFGGEHLRPHSIDMPLYKFVMIDIIVFCFFVLVVVLLTLYICIQKCLNICRNKEKESKHKVKLN